MNSITLILPEPVAWLFIIWGFLSVMDIAAGWMLKWFKYRIAKKRFMEEYKDEL